MNAYYALIQFCPDHGRLEAVNLGVVLYAPELGELGVAVTDDLCRAERWFGFAATARLAPMLRNFVDRLELERPMIRCDHDLRAFGDSRAGEILLSAVRPMATRDSPADELARLFDELVA